MPLPAVDALVQLSFAIQGILGRAAAEHNLSVTQLRLLGILRDRQPGMMQLAQHLELDKSSVTGLIDRAERRNLVTRQAAPEDGRAVRVSATSEALELAAEVGDEIETEVGKLLAGLTKAEVKELAALTSAIVGAVPGRLQEPRQ